MGKEEMKPEKKKMTSMDYGNIIIKYANESGGIDKEELILAGKLLGRGHPKVFAEFLDSMDTAPRELVFQILKDNKKPPLLFALKNIARDLLSVNMDLFV